MARLLRLLGIVGLEVPMGPCARTVEALAPKCSNRDYFKAKVSTIWVHGPTGSAKGLESKERFPSSTLLHVFLGSLIKAK